jgi:hypothetical protein
MHQIEMELPPAREVVLLRGRAQQSLPRRRPGIHDDDDDVLQDGQIYRVPLTLMDGMQRAVAQWHADHASHEQHVASARVVASTGSAGMTGRPLVVDGFGNPAGHKNG